MDKIRLITDSACDIPEEAEKNLDIRILPIPITIGTKGYYERESFTVDEFYDIVEKEETLPATSHILSITYQDEYEKAFAEQFDHVIVVTIYSGASNMNAAAHQAADVFFEEHPEARGKMTIDVIDSKTFSAGYGYPLMEADRKIKEGASYEDVLAYLNDTFSKMEIYFCPFTLKYVKKSGRVSCAAAFVGELLGLRPVISMTGGPSKALSKVRGNAAANAAILEIVKKRLAKGQPYLVLRAKTTQYPEELAKQLEEAVGYPPVGIFKIGASVTINAGPDVAGVAFWGDGWEADAE